MAVKTRLETGKIFFIHFVTLLSLFIINDNIYKFRFRVFVLSDLFVVGTSRGALKDVYNQVKCYRRGSVYAELLAAHTVFNSPRR